MTIRDPPGETMRGVPRVRGHCEVCDLPFRTRREIEDQLDRGMDSDEIYAWIQDRFNFEVSHNSVAGHKDHIFLADFYPFMHLKRPKPDPAKVEEIRQKLRLAARERDHMQFTTEDDAQV